MAARQLTQETPVPLPELVKQLVKGKVGGYCRAKIPAHLQDQIRITHKVRGNNVTIVESHPFFRDPSEWTQHRVAQLRYNPDNGAWSLFCRDRNDKWHAYRNMHARDIDALLAEIEADPTGIFWG